MQGRIKLARRTSVIALVVAGSALIATQTAGFAANGQWKLGSYTAAGGFGFKVAGGGTFTFPVAPNPALLVNDQKPLTGNKSEKTITATFTINDPANTFTYGGEPDGSGGVANARLYFDSASIVSATQVYSNYWWNDADIQVLGNGTFTLTAVIDSTTQWSDYDGKASTDTSSTDCMPYSTCMAAFDAAASHIKDIGISFGGGYFAANGVGTSDGLGTFMLTRFTVS